MKKPLRKNCNKISRPQTNFVVSLIDIFQVNLLHFLFVRINQIFIQSPPFQTFEGISFEEKNTTWLLTFLAVKVSRFHSNQLYNCRPNSVAANNQIPELQTKMQAGKERRPKTDYTVKMQLIVWNLKNTKKNKTKQNS